MSCGQSHVSSRAPRQAMVDQRPKWENQVLSRKSKVIRPDKRKRKRKYL